MDGDSVLAILLRGGLFSTCLAGRSVTDGPVSPPHLVRGAHQSAATPPHTRLKMGPPPALGDCSDHWPYESRWLAGPESLERRVRRQTQCPALWDRAESPSDSQTPEVFGVTS